jgi:hypothetical protein
VLVADFDGDKRPDVIAGNYLFKGDGTGYFHPSLQVPFITCLLDEPFFTADFNRDGKADVVEVTGDVTNYQTVFLGNGNGTFTELPTTIIAGYGVASYLSTDLNGDGFPDLVFLNTSKCDYPGCTGEHIYVELGNGDGTFKTPVALPSLPGWDGAEFHGSIAARSVASCADA